MNYSQVAWTRNEFDDFLEEDLELLAWRGEDGKIDTCCCIKEEGSEYCSILDELLSNRW